MPELPGGTRPGRCRADPGGVHRQGGQAGGEGRGERRYLPILFDNIEDVHTNKTRFIIVSDFKNQPSGEDKTTVLAKIADRPGSLADFLQDFNRAGINLTKIESRPAKSEKAFTSWFYIDFEGHYEENNIKQVLANHTNEIKWLGSYVKGS